MVVFVVHFWGLLIICVCLDYSLLFLLFLCLYSGNYRHQEKKKKVLYLVQTQEARVCGISLGRVCPSPAVFVYSAAGPL